MDVTRKDLDAAGWGWLDRMVSSMCDEEPSEIAYSADQMVDAYIAGTTAQSEAAELRKEVERYGQALISVSRWIASWRQIDLAQECADGGVMSYHVVQQEAAQQMERISAALKETQHEG